MKTPLALICRLLMIAALLVMSAASRSMAQSPLVTTGPADWDNSSTVTLTGTVNPNGLATTVQFEYGTTTAYGTVKSVTLSPNNGTSAIEVGINLGTLPAGTTYHYCISAANASGTTTGVDRVFVTARTSGDYTYTTSDSTATITGYSGPGGVVSIPSNLSGLPVTAIGYNTFNSKSSLTSVTISNSVTSIGRQAFFGCGGLTGMTIPASVANIGTYAFAACSSMTAFTVDEVNDYYSSVDGVLFNKAQNMLIQFPVGRTGTYVVSANVTSIRTLAFFGAMGMTAIVVDPTNSYYSSVDGVLFNKTQTTVLQCPGGKSGDFHIPITATSIGYVAFGGCSALTSVTIPDGVTAIGNGAFDSCSGLTSVIIPSGVKIIGSSIFQNCKGLTSITIPGSVTSIGSQAFFHCESLSSVNLPVNLTLIGYRAFWQCYNLTSVTVPSGVLMIDEGAFYGCTSLRRAQFVGNAPTMGSSVFSNTGGGFTVYYITGKTGFTSPTWQGYPAVALSDPSIIAHPVSVTIASGATTTLTVIAIGAEPLTYQWYQGPSGSTITPVGTNSASFTTPAFTATTAYWVKVTNAANPTGTNSNTATVTMGQPLMITGAATAVTETTATLNGTVNPLGQATTARFEYGLTTAYGTIASVTLAPADGTTVQNVIAAITGLEVGQTYHYRLTATNSGGTFAGRDAIFTTAPPTALNRVWVGLGNQTFPEAIWGGYANWTASQPANGANNIATFGDSFGDGYACILNYGVSLGRVVYNDPANANDFILRSDAGDYVLTLDVTSGLPSFNVAQAGRTLIIQPRIGGNDGFTKNGPGRLVLANGNSTYTGPIQINGGILEIGGGVFTVNNGKASPNYVEQAFDLGTAGRVGNGTYAGSVVIAGGAGFLYNSSANTTFNGVISGGGSLGQAGTGTLTLTNANTYTGTTAVSGGTLRLDSSSSLPAATDLIMSGGKLDLNGQNATVQSLTVGAAGGIIDFGTGNSGNTLQITAGALAGWTGNLVLLNFNPATDALFFGSSVGGINGNAARVIFADPIGLPAGNYALIPGVNGAAALSSLPIVPPTITNQPASQNIPRGSTATLTVVATGTEPLTYQWYQGPSGTTTTPVGANSSSFTTPALTSTTSYWVKVTNIANPTGEDSNAATVMVPPTVLTGPIFNPANGHTYYLLTQNNWTASQAEAVTLGGHLVTINDLAENDWVLATFGNHGGSAKGLWIGLHDGTTEGTFAWASGQAAAFRNWAAGEPSTGNAGEDFVHLYEPGRAGGLGGKWNVHTDQTTESGVPLHGVVEVGGVGKSDVYTDSINDSFFPDGHVDIAAVNVELDAAIQNLTFRIRTRSTPLSPDWGKFMIAIRSGDGGTAAGNGWDRPINFAAGMTQWIGVWVDTPGGDGTSGDGVVQRYAADSGWSVIGAPQVTKHTDYIEVRTSLAMLSLELGEAFSFDVYTSGAGAGDGALDALSTAQPTISDWWDPFTTTSPLTFLLALPPIVTTGPADWDNSSTVTLTGTVNPNGLATTVQFEYGATTAYGTTETVTLSPDNGATDQSVSVNLGTLPAGTTYHYRLTATNAGGTTAGADRVFITARTAGDYTYTTSDSSAAITAYTGAGGAVAIPATLNGLTVTAIGYLAFYNYNTTTLISVSIPASVTSIGSHAFYYRTSLATVTMPNSVTSIGDSAFYKCSSLTNITIPNSLTSIGDSAFYNCPGLTGIIIPNSVTSIGGEAFAFCAGLTSVTISSSVTTIRGYAFYGCTGLTSVTIPDSVTSIESSSFRFCTGLTSVTIPSSVHAIGTVAFGDCPQLVTVVFQGDAPYLAMEYPAFARTSPDFTVFYYAGNSGFWTPIWNGYPAVCIGESVAQIAVDQPVGFRLDSGNSRDFGSGTHSSPASRTFTIRNRGGLGLTGLAASITGPHAADFTVGALSAASVAPLDACIFEVSFTPSGTGLRTATLRIASNDPDANPFEVLLIGNPTLADAVDIPELVFTTGGTAPWVVVTRDSYDGSDAARSDTIGNGQESWMETSVTGPGMLGFWWRVSNTLSGSYGWNDFALELFVDNASQAGRITAPSDWRECRYTIPAGTHTLKWRFARTNGNGGNTGWVDQVSFVAGDVGPLVTTSPADSVTAITATLNGTVNPTGLAANAQFEYGTTTAYGNTAVVTLNPSNGALTQTLAANLSGLLPDTTYHYRLTATNSLGTAYGADMTFTTLPAYLYSINNGEVTITGYRGPGEVTIPATIEGLPVTAIGNMAFFYLSNVTSVSIPSSVTSIGSYPFYYCTKLTAITVDAANPNYSSQDGVLFNKGITTLIQCPGGKTGAYAIPASVTSIGGWAFSGCAGLTSVSIPASVTSIGDNAFRDCTGLTSVTLPASVISIGEGAFTSCSGLTSVSIPTSVTSIERWAFSNCTGLTSAAFLGNAPTMGSIVFYNTAASFSVYYLNTSTDFTSPTWQGYPAVALADPGFINHPASTTINSGGIATLAVNVAGTDPLTFQWYEGVSGDTGSPVGLNSATFTTPALMTTTSYWVRVTNAANPTGADSNTATITVNHSAAIADNALASSSLAVANFVGPITDVNVALEITHPNTSDLTLWLLSPQGTRVLLVDRAGGTGDNYTATVFDDEAVSPITSGTAPFAGSFRPAESLSTFDGQDPNGIWTLEILDQATGNTGTLTNWSLQFDIGSAPAALTVTTHTPLADWPVGVAYSRPLTALGGTPPYTWTVVAGALPPPLVLNPTTGVITGTPTTGGLSIFRVKATDAASHTATKDLSLTIRRDSSALTVETPSSGMIASAGEADEFTFFARAGQSLTVVVNPGASGTGAATPPVLNRVRAELRNPAAILLASGENTAAGQVLVLENIAIPAGGTHTLRIKAPASASTVTGNYTVTVWDATLDTAALAFNSQLLGKVDNPYNIDCWTFSAVAGQQVRFRLLSPPNSGTGFSLAGPAAWSGFTDLTADSDLLTLPATGSYTLTAHSLGGAYGAGYSFRLDETSQQPIIAGTPLSGRFNGSAQAQIFALTVTDAMPLLLQLANSGTGNQVEIYAKLGAPPTRGDFDFKFGTPAVSNQQILVPTAATGTWYILVYGDSIPTPSDFTLTALLEPVLLTGVSPARFGNGADTVLTVTGAGFEPGTEVHLLAAGGSAFPAAASLSLSGTDLRSEFPAWSLPAGSYGLRVTLPGGSQAELPASVEVVANARAIFNSWVISPGAIRYNAPATIFVEYSNDGDLAMPAPMLELSGIQNGKALAFLTMDEELANKWFTADSLPDGFRHTLRFLASGANPGTLQPGETVRVPVYYGGWQQPWYWSYPPITFGLRILRHDNNTPVDWTGRFGALAPGAVDPERDAMLDTVQTAMGSTWGQYVTSLGQTAGLLFEQLGAEVRDVEELEFQMLQGIGGTTTAQPAPQPAPLNEPQPAPPPADPPQPAPAVVQPGTVFKYSGGSWIETASDETLSSNSATYVIVHGWNDSVNMDDHWQASMAAAIKSRDSGANVLAVDWSRWSKTGSFILRANTAAMGIPEVADRVSWRLFAPKGVALPDHWRMMEPGNAIMWYGQGADTVSTPVKGLGLTPINTHIIGHSHGAHVAGLTAEYSMWHYGFGFVKRVTALDPSNELSHGGPGNYGGRGWGNVGRHRTAAYIDAYRSSKAGPFHRTFGDDNFLLAWDGYDYDDADLNDGEKHHWAHWWFSNTIFIGGGPLGLGFDWEAGKWSDVTRNRMGSFVGQTEPWKGLIRGGITEHVLEALSPAVERSGDYQAAWRYPGAWKGSSFERSIVSSLAGRAEFEPRKPDGPSLTASAGGPLSFSFHVVDNSDIRSVSRLWRSMGRGGVSTDARYRVWLSKQEPFEKSRSISLTTAADPRPIYEGQWTMRGDDPLKPIPVPGLAIPSKSAIEAKWPGITWPASLNLVVELSDGRLIDMYQANNTCAIPIVLDGVGLAASVEPVAVTDGDNNGSESVTLDGRASQPKSEIVNYRWELDGTAIGNGPTLDHMVRVVPVGQHTATLTVTDGSGNTHTASAAIVVHPGEPQPPTNPGPTSPSIPVGPVDPNELIGPAGYGLANHVMDRISLPYRINFENDEDATAPAQIVEITNPLPAEFDLATFEWTEVGFGDINITIPQHTRHYETTLEVEIDGEAIEVSILATLNVDQREAYVRFVSLDPLTKSLPGALTGFLPPEDGTGRGMGHVSYIVKAKPSLPAGTAIRNIAYIVFDGQPAIATNQVDPHDPSKGTDPGKEALVTIDSSAPSGSVNPLPEFVNTEFEVSWGGDDGGDSGVASYTVYVSDDGGLTWSVWVADTQLTSAQFVGVHGKSYRFYVVAKDWVGNVQVVDPASAAVGTIAVGLSMIEIQQPAGTPLVPGVGKVDFGTVRLGFSALRTFTIHNAGPMPLKNLAVQVTGDQATEFTLIPPTTDTLAVGSSITFTVNFAPSSVGERGSLLRVTSNDPHVPSYDISLAGTGSGNPEIWITVDGKTGLVDGSGSLDFGKIVAGAKSAPKTFTIRNTGNGGLGGLKIVTTGKNAADFRVGPLGANTVAPGGSTTFTVAFNPAAVGARTAVLQVVSNDADENPFDIGVKGTGLVAPQIAVIEGKGNKLVDGKSSLDFGKASVGASGLVRTITIANSGKAALGSISLAIDGKHASDFVMAPLKAKSLAPGKSAKFKITFKPKGKGKRNAMVHIKSNDPRIPSFDFVVKGTGNKAAKKSSPVIPLHEDLEIIGDRNDRMRVTYGTTRLAGRRFRTIDIRRPNGGEPKHEDVQVSPNLLDWFSGPKHTTVVEDTADRLKVRDNTPLEDGKKRFIRLKPRR